jgi:hypothetical protein
MAHQVRHCLKDIRSPNKPPKEQQEAAPAMPQGGPRAACYRPRSPGSHLSLRSLQAQGLNGSHVSRCLKKKVYHQKTTPWHDWHDHNMTWHDLTWSDMPSAGCCKMLQIYYEIFWHSHLSFQQIADCIVVVLLCPGHSVPRMHMRRPHRSKRLGTGRNGVRSPWQVTIRALPWLHGWTGAERHRKTLRISSNNPIAYWFSKAHCEWRHESQHALHKRIELQGFLAWMNLGSCFGKV